MHATIKVPSGELAKLSQSFEMLKRLTKKTEREIIRGEAGVILKSCISQTPVANPTKVASRERARRFSEIGLTQADRGGVSVNAGIRGIPGRAWFRTRKNKFQIAANIGDRGDAKYQDIHWRGSDWRTVSLSVTQAARAINGKIEKAKRAIALARNSWLQIADAAGIDISAAKGGGRLSAKDLAQVRAALPTNGKRYQNGTAYQDEGANQYSILLVNTYPKAHKAGLSGILKSVLVRRARYFDRNMRLGVFDSMKKAERAYPFLKTEGASE